jgi:hypothetical protein
MTELNRTVLTLCTALVHRLLCVAIVLTMVVMIFHVAYSPVAWRVRHRSVSITCTGGAIPVIVDNRRVGCQR